MKASTKILFSLITLTAPFTINAETLTVDGDLVVENTITSNAGESSFYQVNTREVSFMDHTDGFRMYRVPQLNSNSDDYLIFEKTDGNGNNPDGGILFAGTGADGIMESHLTIKGNGNIGIGTTNPGYSLSLAGDRMIRIGPNTGWGQHLFLGGNGRTVSQAQVFTTNGNLHLDSKNSTFETFINFYSNGDTLLNANDGNVGIGLREPLVKLHVDGGLIVEENAAFKGVVTMAEAQGDISMGAFGTGL